VSKPSKKEKATGLLIGEVVAIVLTLLSANARDWSSLVLFASAAIAIPCWVIGFRMPVDCNVITGKRRPCPNSATGVLFGCGNAKGHTWGKFFGHFGLGRAAARKNGLLNGPVANGGTVEFQAAGTSIPTVRVAGDAKTEVIFWMTIVSTLSGVVSAIITLIQL
jgi:hypothetical protein